MDLTALCKTIGTEGSRPFRRTPFLEISPLTPKISMRRASLTTFSIVAISSAAANADITGAFSFDSISMADQFGGGQVPVFVQDLYFISNNPDDVVLAAFDLLLEPTAQIDYYQAPLGYGWNPRKHRQHL